MNESEVSKIVSTAFSFSDNIIERIQSSIDAGTVSGDDLQNAKDTVESYNAHNAKVMDMIVYDNSTDEDYKMKQFSILRSYLMKHKAELAEVKTDIYEKLCPVCKVIFDQIESKINGTDTTEYVNLLKDLKDSKYSSNQSTSTNSAELIKELGYDGETKSFTAEDGEDYVKTGIKFLESILDRIESAKEPDQAKIDAYKHAIQVLKDADSAVHELTIDVEI